MTFKELTKQYLENDVLFSKLEKYVELIEKYNKVMNLTGFSDDRLWEEGIYESIISLETAFGKNLEGKLLDIGAGAGFPSVPYLIINPALKLSIFEPQVKRLKFLKVINNELDLDIELINTRVEDFNYHEIFDYVTARAVSTLRNILQASVHVAKKEGIFSFIKGPRYIEELEEAKSLLKNLNYPFETIKVPLKNKETWIVKIRKNKSSPKKYPMLWKDIKTQ